MDPEGFIRNHMQQLVRTNPLPELISKHYHQHPDFTQNLESLPQELKRLFQRLFNAQKAKISLKELLPFKPKKGNVAFCHRMLTHKVDSYRCFDCLIHPDCLLCEDCFKKGNHEGHRYIQLKQEGDCDCGSKNLIKESGFCPQHCGAQEIIEIDSSQEFVFNLYIRQIFIWILKLIKIEPKDGELLLLYLLSYLAEINQLSPYYNKLTNHALFAENDPIAYHIFYISLNAAERGKIIQANLNLFFKMLPLKEFKQKLLTSLINNYNKLDGFEISKYVKLFCPLLNEPQVVVSAMTANPIALRPERQFNVMAFYNNLAIIKDITPSAAQAFLKPLLLADYIIFPFLGRIEERCQKMNNLIVTVFPEFQSEEHIYYRLLMDIIKVTDDKQVLGVMIGNYCKMILEYSFKKNKIILVPQRILALLLYKYFDFDLQKMNPNQMIELLGLTQELFYGQIIKNWIKFAQCLFEFSLNLNHTNYFENYLNLYTKQNGQIICLDYLGFKIMAALSKGRKDSFNIVLDHIFRVDYDHLNREKEELCDIIKARNIFLKIIMEIIYSTRTESVMMTLLGCQDTHSLHFFKLICQRTGEITQQQLQDIGQLFYYKKLNREIIDAVLNFDLSKRKYIPRPIQQGESINLQFFVSLLQTKFSKFIQKKNETGGYLQLDDKQEELKETLLSCKTLFTMSMRQLILIQGHPEDKMLIRDLIRTIKMIKLAYRRQQREYDDMLLQIVDHINRKYKQTQTEQCPNRLFCQQIEKQLSSNYLPKTSQYNNDKQAQRRKQLLRLKKEKVLKAKKIKQNQQKFLEPQKEQQEETAQEICLICRQNKDNDQICYVGKMRFTSLLQEFMQSAGDNAIFKSCFHTVHFDCFMRMGKTKEAASCPLCKCAINIVLPLENNPSYGLLEKISTRIQHVLNFFILSGESKEKRGFILQIILYFAYLFAVNINDLGSFGQRQMRLFRILSTLLEHNMDFQDRQIRAEVYYQLFYNKLKTQNDVLFYTNLINLMQALVFWNANSKSQVDYPLECLYSLSFHCSKTKISQILKIINSFLSPPQVSALEPIIIAFEEITSKVQEQDENVSIVKFLAPPTDVYALLKLRDISSVQCKVGHQICICSICQRPFCLTCKKTVQHAKEDHPRECVFFNTYSGGFLYYFQGLEIVIRCLYTNDIGKTWKPELTVEGFSLDKKVYSDILGELKGGSLFNYLISTFQGLKGNSIADRI